MKRLLLLIVLTMNACGVAAVIEPGAIPAGATIVMTGGKNLRVSFRSPANLATTTSLPPTGGQLPITEVSYCHRTSAVINPYRLLTTDVNAVVSRGHGSHTGPIFPEVGPGQNGKWGDIIPPFDYDNGEQHFPGLNWPAGSDVLNAGCAVHETIEPPTEETTTTTAAATTTTAVATTTTSPASSTSAPPSGTSTTAPAPVTTTSTSTTTTTPEETTTTRPLTGTGSTTTLGGGVTTTTTATEASGSTTTTASALPPTATPPPTAAPLPLDPPPVNALPPGESLSEPPPPVLAFVIAPGNRLVTLGVLSPKQVRTLFRELAHRKLAHTGSSSGVLLLIALVTVLSGAALVGASARRQRRPT